MKKLLIVVDMQNDFVSGALGSPQAEAIVPQVKAKIQEYKNRGDEVIFTRDTHAEDYLKTQEGKYLPVKHCITGTEGHRIISELDTENCLIIDKPAFGSLELAKIIAGEDGGGQRSDERNNSRWSTDRDISVCGYDEIELCGLCTDICVVSNALILKAGFPETKISVDAACCAGVSNESHEAALLTMKMCHISILEPGSLSS